MNQETETTIKKSLDMEKNAKSTFLTKTPSNWKSEEENGKQFAYAPQEPRSSRIGRSGIHHHQVVNAGMSYQKSKFLLKDYH